MKNKLLFVLIFAVLIACLFVASVSAAEVIDGLTYDFNSNGTAKLTNANKTLVMETVIVPEKIVNSQGKEYTVTTVNEGAFRDNKSIKYLSLPPTITSIGGGAFYGCTSLVFVDFNDNLNAISMASWGVFRNCTSLKAVCLPDNVKTIGDQAFTGCSALTAVYLPANVELIKGNKSAWDGPAFGNSPYMYLVNEKFDVRDENENFYTESTFVPPPRPDVYYFPSTLKAITGAHNVKSAFTMDENGIVNNNAKGNSPYEDCAFYNLPSINPVLVLPESYQGFDDRVLNASGKEAQYSDHRGDTVADGLFQYCGTKEKPLTVVFLGEIDRVSFSRIGKSNYTTYVFANPANTGFDNTVIGTWSDSADVTYTGQEEMYIVFCHANNKSGAKYKIGFEGQSGNEAYPVLTSELCENVQIHTENPMGNVISSQPDCITNMLVNTFCFCGAAVNKNVQISGTALGHEFDLAKGALEHSIVYENYVSSGIRNVQCARCTEKNGEYVAPVISSFKGYSTKIDGNGIAIGYTFNYDALNEYARVNKRALEFGFVLAVKALLGDNAPLDGDGNELDGAVRVSVDQGASSGFELKIYGDWEKTVNINGTELKLKDLELILCGYVFDGSVNYLQKSGSTKDASDIICITYSEV